MKNPIVHEKEPLTLVGGADFAPAVLNICLIHAPKTVAADGGANRLLSSEIKPLAVIGDFDSLSDAARTAFADVLYPKPDQNLTDFEKALGAIAAPLILAPGFLGGRLDHTMAALNTLIRHADRPVILLGADDLAFVVRGQVTLDPAPGTRLALLPLTPVTVTTTGLRWDLTDATLAPDGLVSSSNETARQRVTLQTDGPVIVTLALSALDAAIAAVRAE